MLPVTVLAATNVLWEWERTHQDSKQLPVFTSRFWCVGLSDLSFSPSTRCHETEPLFYSLALRLVILASTILDRKSVGLSGWQVARCRRAVVWGDLPMASVWAFLFSQASARPRVPGTAALIEDAQ